MASLNGDKFSRATMSETTKKLTRASQIKYYTPLLDGHLPFTANFRAKAISLKWVRSISVRLAMSPIPKMALIPTFAIAIAT